MGADIIGAIMFMGVIMALGFIMPMGAGFI
jgi:hypothetical protein